MAIPTPVFECPTCGRKSANPNDIRERFCGVCGFADVNWLKAEPEIAIEENRQRKGGPS